MTEQEVSELATKINVAGVTNMLRHVATGTNPVTMMYGIGYFLESYKVLYKDSPMCNKVEMERLEHIIKEIRLLNLCPCEHCTQVKNNLQKWEKEAHDEATKDQQSTTE